MTRSGGDDLTLGKIDGEGGAEPFDGGGIAVDEDDFFGADAVDIRADAFAGGVGTELESLEIAAEGLRREFGAELHRGACGGGTEATRWGKGIGVTDKKEGVFGVADDLAGEGIGESFFGHHPAGNGVEALPVEGGSGGGLTRHCVRGEGIEELEGRILAGGFIGEPIVDFGEFGAETADINGAVAEEPALAEAVEKGEHFLGLAEGEEGDEDGGVAGELFFDGLDEAIFFSRTGEGIGGGMIASGGFDDQDIEGFIGEGGPLHDRLVIELDIARVEDGTAFGANEHSDRAEDVAGVEKLHGDGGGFVGAEAFAGEIEAGVEGNGTPPEDGLFDFAMGEERVIGHAFVALFEHDIDGIVKHDVAELAGGFGHEDGGAWVAAHEEGDGAEVILVGVGKENGVDGIGREEAMLGEREVAVDSGVETGVENEAFTSEVERVAISADFDFLGEIGKSDIAHTKGGLRWGDRVNLAMDFIENPRRIRGRND